MAHFLLLERNDTEYWDCSGITYFGAAKFVTTEGEASGIWMIADWFVPVPTAFTANARNL